MKQQGNIDLSACDVLFACLLLYSLTHCFFFTVQMSGNNKLIMHPPYLVCMFTEAVQRPGRSLGERNSFRGIYAYVVKHHLI